MLRIVSGAALAGCIVLALGHGVRASPPAPTIGDWRHDIRAIVAAIVTNHPDPFAKVGRTTFLRNAQALEDRLARMTDEQRLAGVMRLVATLGDGHTSVYPNSPRFAQFYPVRFFPFADGLFITSAHASVADLAGAKVTRIGGRPVDDVLPDIRAMGSADNDVMSRYQIAALHSVPLMRALGLADARGALPLTVQPASGASRDVILLPHRSDSPQYGPDSSTFDWIWSHEVWPTPVGTLADWVTGFRGKKLGDFRAPDASRPAHLSGLRVNSGIPLPAEDAYYIQLLIVNDTANEALDAFWHRVMSEVDQQKPRRLIVDLRRNPGGDGSRVPMMIAEFIRRQAAPPWKELYVVTSGRTFSASIMTLSAFMTFTEASYVGEPAGAALNSFGDATVVDLPQTGLQLHVSTLRHDLTASTDLSAFTRVDYPAVWTFADWAAGRDPALDAILGGQARSITAIAADEGGAAAARAFAEREKAFGQLPWFQPPPETAMIRAAQTLESAGRLKDALALLELNARIRPQEWRSWENLGNAQLSSGDSASAMDSFRKSIDADPGNFEVPRMRSLLASAMFPRSAKFGEPLATVRATLGSGHDLVKATHPVGPEIMSGAAGYLADADVLGQMRPSCFFFVGDRLAYLAIPFDSAAETTTLDMLSRDLGAPQSTGALRLYASGGIAYDTRTHALLLYPTGLTDQIRNIVGR